MAEVVPSILVKDRNELIEKLSVANSFAEVFHLDVTDGIFVNSLTLNDPVVMPELASGLSFSVHLMVAKPENHIVKWLASGADQFIFHIESTSKAQTVINYAKEADKQIGVALNPETNFSEIESVVNEVDFVHFLSVKPGFYGGKFDESVADKIKDFHFYYPDKTIWVDGGVNPQNAPDLVRAGASVLIVGNFIFSAQKPEEAFAEIKGSIENV